MSGIKKLTRDEENLLHLLLFSSFFNFVLSKNNNSTNVNFKLGEERGVMKGIFNERRNSRF